MDAPTAVDAIGADLDIVLVEDSTSDAELAIWRLTQAGFRCNYRVVAREEELLQALRERAPNVVLSGFHLPEFDGMAALAVAVRVAPEVPFIFFCSAIGE